MSTLSLRWLFVAVFATALAVTAVMNANELWMAATEFMRAGFVGVSVLFVIFRGRAAPFAIGFATFSLLAAWLLPSFELDDFMRGDTKF